MDRGVTLVTSAGDSAGALLGPYVPTVVVDWLRDRPQERHRSLDCTLVFADVSGFTRLTEMLGARGKIGAEEMAGLINGTFERLLVAAYSYDAGLIKWGGDATLLLFEGEQHVERGCRAAAEMQRVMRENRTLRTSRGAVRLRMSIGVHSGRSEFFLVGAGGHRELIVTGESATTLTRMEKVAGPGQIVVSDGTASALGEAGHRVLSDRLGDGWLLRRPPPAARKPADLDRIDGDVDVGVALCRTLREHVLGGGLEYEHREAAVGFIQFTGVDQLLVQRGPEHVRDVLDVLIARIQSATERRGVAFLATDLGPDGGKVMLSAGAPQHLGEEADRMIAAAREVLDDGGPLALRAGITCGRVFAGDYGPPYRRTYSLMGDCVNLAARLMAHADPGDVLVSAEVPVAASDEVAFVVAPPFAAKGKRAPVRPLRVDARGSAPAAHERPRHGARDGPMIGRDDELSVLVDAAGAAATGDGSAVDLVGEPGMGKSRLLQEVASMISAEVLWVGGEVYSGGRPYAPFERLVRRRYGVGADASGQELAARLQAVTEAHVPHLIPWLPLIGIAAGVEFAPTREVEQTDPAQRRARLEEATSELLGAILSGPTALFFNDVHLMDDATRSLIRRLAVDASSRRWLVVASRRPDGPTPLDEQSTTRVELGPLGTTDAAELLARATADAPLPAHRLTALAERAAGNPLFLRELVAQLAAGGDSDELPRSVEGAIAARIDRLDRADRWTLRSASVLGVDVDAVLLDEVLGLASGAQVGDARRLEGLGEFLEPVAPGRWRFNHQLVREVAYEALPYGRRTELHALTASALERRAGGSPDDNAELLSIHLFHGAQYMPAWWYARAAAERARARYAGPGAAEAYRRALAAAAFIPGEVPPDELIAVDEALGELCIELGELRDADIALRRGLRRASGDPLSSARLELKLAYLREIPGRYTAALRWAARAERTLAGQEGAEARRLQGRLAVRRAGISYRRGRHAAGMAFARTAAELARESGDRPALAQALEYGDVCAVEAGLPTGSGAQQALAIYEELQDVGSEARVRNTLGMLAFHHGEWPEALRHYHTAEDAWTRAGKHWDAATAVANAAEVLANQGKLAEAEVALERAMRIWRGAGAASEVAFGEYQLGRVAAHSGRAEEASERFEAARVHFHAAGELSEVVVVDALAAEALELAGDPEAALELADAALTRATSLGATAVVPLVHRVRGVALWSLGDAAAAEAALRAGLAVARARGARHEIAFTLRALVDRIPPAGGSEARAWREELNALVALLGIEPAHEPDGQATCT
jgi:class 3 adenylate cyclase/tetratricopeptide (TPR) repeat protein